MSDKNLLTPEQVLELAEIAGFRAAHHNRVLRLSALIQGKYLRRVDELQCKIDQLMLEYCPDEMTEEQLAEWQRHQKAITEAEAEWLEHRGRSND